jgi:hypothetical protein
MDQERARSEMSKKKQQQPLLHTALHASAIIHFPFSRGENYNVSGERKKFFYFNYFSVLVLSRVVVTIMSAWQHNYSL